MGAVSQEDLIYIFLLNHDVTVIKVLTLLLLLYMNLIMFCYMIVNLWALLKARIGLSWILGNFICIGKMMAQDSWFTASFSSLSLLKYYNRSSQLENSWWVLISLIGRGVKSMTSVKFLLERWTSLFHNVSSDENVSEIGIKVGNKVSLCFSIFELVDVCFAVILLYCFWKLGHGLYA